MLTDFYEFTMAAGYFAQKIHEKEATFDLFVRQFPPGRDYLIVAGLEQVIEFLSNYQFKEKDVDFILHQPMFHNYKEKDAFRQYLLKMKFTGTLRAIEEGRLVFPNEPILEITAPLIQAQLIETALLSIIGHQTMIASKASRIVKQANEKPVIDFGARRSHGLGAALFGSRACFIGGCNATSNCLTGEIYGVPVSGTQAHSWIQSFPSEIDAFRAYLDIFPERAILLIDTYDLNEGAKTAAKLNSDLITAGKPHIYAVRIDSGDLITNSNVVRRVLDENGGKEIKIIVSSDLNESKIQEIVKNHAPVDGFGVGTEMMVSQDCPSISVVYKMVEFEGKPKIKLSESKHTYPCKKQIFRTWGKIGEITDTLALHDERHKGEPLLKTYIDQGNNIYPKTDLHKIQQFAVANVQRFTLLKKLVISNQLQQKISELVGK
jgi:nicotinate phosphoribosyltransferase